MTKPPDPSVAPVPDAVPPAPDAAAEEALLVSFLRDRSVACPACRYDLRNLAGARCPECRAPLHLAVAGPPPPLVRLFVAAAPGIFSGIAAGVLCVVMIVATLDGETVPPGPYALAAFGLASGIVGLLLVATARRRFFLWPPSRGWMAAALIWSVHLAMFGLMFLVL